MKTPAVSAPFIAVVIAVGLVNGARAAETSWIAPRDGAFFDAGRWTNGFPTATDIAIFGLTPGSLPFNVALRGPTTILELRATTQSPTFALDGSSFACSPSGNGLIVGATDTTTSCTFHDGPITAPSVSIGLDAGADAMLTLENASINAATCTIAGAGQGSLQLDSGASATFAGLIVGNQAGVGVVDVGSDSNLSVGSNKLTFGTNGSVHVHDGGKLTAAKTIFTLSAAPDALEVIGSGSSASIGAVPFGGIHVTLGEGAIVSASTSFQVHALHPTSSLTFVIGPSGSGQFNVNGILNLAGALTVQLADGFVPAPNVFYTLMTGLALTGEFDFVELPTIYGVPLTLVNGGGLLFAIVADANTSLVVTPDPLVAIQGFLVKATASLIFTGAQVVNATSIATWSVMDPSIASIDSDGNVRGLLPGRTILTASYGSLAASTALIVDPPPTPPMIVRASETVAHVEGNDESWDGSSEPAISANGNFIAFVSRATNLVPNDNNNKNDVFVKNRLTGALSLASAASDGTLANADCEQVCISADGRWVAFTSAASNLVAGDTNGASDVFVHDLQTGATEIVAIDPPEGVDVGASRRPALSADGRFVAIITHVSTRGGPALGWRAYRKDRLVGTTDLVSVDPSAAPTAVIETLPLGISNDGSVIVFGAYMPQVTLHTQTWLRDLSTNELICASQNSAGTFANGNSSTARVDASGQTVAFLSSANNLLPVPSNVAIYVFNRADGALEFANLNNNDEPSDGYIGSLSMSADGRFVTFRTDSPNFDLPFQLLSQVVRRDRLEATTDLVSIGPVGFGNYASQYGTATNADGSFIAFGSRANNLVPFDTNDVIDTFVRSMGAPILGDLDGDGIIDASDLAILLGAWGSDGADLDGNGTTGASDLSILLGAWTGS